MKTTCQDAIPALHTAVDLANAARCEAHYREQREGTWAAKLTLRVATLRHKDAEDELARGIEAARQERRAA